jgi:hypothetical protein
MLKIQQKVLHRTRYQIAAIYGLLNSNANLPVDLQQIIRFDLCVEVRALIKYGIGQDDTGCLDAPFAICGLK